MKIKRFVGRRINGHLNFDINFFNKLTFVTGINGSGKTSALNSIAALLLPRLDYLANLQFEAISLRLATGDETVTLSAMHADSGPVLSCSKYPDDDLFVIRHEPTESYPPHRGHEVEQDYYEEFLARNADHPVLGYIQSLPTPMYLGLDRRSLSPARERPHFRSRYQSTARQNIFRRSLDLSLREAVQFARDHRQEVRVLEASLDADTREKIVLELIDFPPLSISSVRFSAPSRTELKKFEDAKRHLSRLPQLLSVPDSVISSKIDPVIDFLNTTLTKMREDENSEETRLAAYEVVIQ